MFRSKTPFFLILLYVSQACCLSPCCNYCLGLSASNTIAICDYNYRNTFSCPTASTCKLWERSDGYSYVVTVNGCSDCPAGFFRDQSTTQCRCSACTTNANVRCTPDVGWYVSQVCGPNNDRVCSQCDSCGLGTYLSSCTESSATCSNCPTGTYRSSLSVKTCTGCKDCNRQARERRTSCGPIYDRTCVTCDAGHIVTGADLDICTPCNSPQYPSTYAVASSNTCVGCTTCDRTQQMTKDCAADGDRTCAACTDFKRSTSLNGACDGCVQNYFRTGANSCAKCADSSCGWGNYRQCTYTDNGGGVKTCTACQGQKEAFSTQCNAGYGVSTRCNGENTDAVTCSQCGAGTERPAGTALVGDIQACVACSTGYYKLAAGTSRCTACSNKPALNTQYTAWGSTAPSTSTCPW